MNRIYRSVWNEISRTFVAAAETVRGRGKPTSSCAEATPAARRPVLARRRPMMLALEQRFMFDGAAVAPVAEAAAAAAAAEAHAAVANAIPDAPAPVEVRAADPAKDGGKTEVVFVDTSVADYKTLEAGIKAGVAIVEIDGSKDGLAQIAQWAQTHSGYDSIAILGHGEQATLHLGTTTLTTASLSSATVQTELAEVGQALTNDGDLMLYGCDVAKGAEGEAFIAALASATGADVAASTDTTGAQAKGGDWALEKASGSVESSLVVEAPAAYAGVLANTTVDFNDATSWPSGGDSYSYAGFTWNGFNRYESASGGMGVDGSAELILASSNTTASIASSDGSLFTPVSIALHIWTTTDPTVTFVGYRDGIEVARADYVLTQTAGLHTANTNFLSFSSLGSAFAAIDKLEIVPTKDGGSATSAGFDNFVYTTSQLDATTTVSAGTVVAEPVSLPATDGNGATVSVFDFKISDAGTSDGAATNITQVVLNTSGSGDFSQVYCYLSGTDAPNVYGTYDNNAHTLTFSNLNISVANGASETYTISVEYYNDLTDGSTFALSLAPNSGLTVSDSGSQLASGQAAVSNGSGSVYEVTAPAALVIDTQPAGSTSGSALTTPIVVHAVDANGNIDRDFNGNVTLSENDAGSLSGTLTVAAVNGVATFTNVIYRATADNETFQLDASANGLTSVTSADVVSHIPPVSISSATYDAATGILAVSAANLTAGDTIVASRLTLTGEGGATYTLTSADVTAASATTFAVTLNAADRAALGLIVNRNGSSSTGGTAFSLAAADDWDSNVSAGDSSDSGNALTVANVAVPTISGATYDAETGVLTVSGSNLSKLTGGTNDIDVGKLTLIGDAGSYTLTSANVEITGAGSFAVTLNAADRAALASRFNKSGMVSAGGVSYNIAAAEDWAAGAEAGVAVADLTGNAISVVVPNAAPMLTPDTPSLNPITEKETDNAGQTVASFFGSSISDTNSGALQGIAITALASGNGAWQYSTDDGGSWVAVGTVTGDSALLLRATDTIRFVPNGVSGTSAGITYRAWDQTSGTAGDKVSTTSNGGKTAFSTASNSASIAVSDVNDKPTAVAISGSNVSVFDGVNATVGALTTTDVDGPTSSLTYTLVSVSLGSASLEKTLFNVSGSDLRAAQPGSLQAGTYSVVVEVSDGDKTYQQTLSVTVSDTLTVTTADNNGDNATAGGGYSTELADGNGLSLREAVALAGARTGGATIRFAAGLGTVTFGSLTIDRDITIDTDALTTLTIGGNFTIASGKTLTLSNGAGDTLTLLHSIEGYGTLAKAGSGTLTLSAPSEYGGTRVDGGTLAIAGSGALGSGGVSLADGTTLAVSGTTTLTNAITLAGSATIDVDADATLALGGGEISGNGGFIKTGAGTLDIHTYNLSSGATRVDGGTLSIASDANLGGGALTLAGGTTLAVTSAAAIDNAIVLTGNATIDSGLALTLSGVVSGDGGLTKTGSGSLMLSGNNGYKGTTTVSAGCLSIDKDSNLGAGAVSLAAGATLGVGTATTIDNAIELTGTGNVTFSNSAALTLAGTIAGSGGLTKDGTGKLTLAGANGSYGGAITVNEGTLAIAGDGKLGSGALTLANDAKLELSGTTTISNAIVLAGNATSIVTDSGAVATLSGNVTAPTLTKSGGGTLILSVDSKTINLTRVAGGTLQVDTTLGGAVSAEAGTVSGRGSINGSLTIESAATLAPGAAGVGTLIVGNTLTLNGTLAIDIASASSYDRIVAKGIAYGAGSTISVSCLGAYAPSGATAFLLIDNSGATSGELKGLAQGKLLTQGDTDYTVSYNASGSSGSASLTLTSLARPIVTGVGSIDKALNKIGDVITIGVAFDRAVIVTGKPTLLLETGATDRVATYLSGNGSNNLTFSYTVQAGDVSSPSGLDYASTGALTLNGGTIVDATTGKSAVLTLGTLGGGHSMIDTSTINVDGVVPTASIALSAASLKIGDTATVTITFSEAVSGLTNDDLTVANGTLSGLSSSNGGVTWSATFTPSVNVTDASNVVTLANAGVSDWAGNAGAGVTASANYAIDTQRPSATIVVADSTLAAGETSLVTITFSEAVTGLTNNDLNVANGTLSGLSSNDGGVTWTAVLTPTAGIKAASNLIRLDNSGVADLAGNAGSATTNSNSYAVSTVRPTATIVVADSALKAGETSLVTITFSEAVTGFTNADLAVANGTLSAVTSSDGGITWSATLTPGDHVSDSSNVITLNAAGVTSIAGSAGAGTTDSNSYAVDSERPSATIVLSDSSLAAGETATVFITFSEAVSGFSNADLAVANGTLSTVTSSDGGITWTATFTPTADVTDASNVITLNQSGVQDGAGNSGAGTSASSNYAVLTAKTLSYSATTLSEAAANDGSISTTATITLANETFAGADGSTLGTVSNVPAGLSAQLIKVDATHARLSLTGKASAHANAQDLNNLTVSFADADFAGSQAAAVAGATTTLAIDFADPAALPVPPLPPVPPVNVVAAPVVVVPVAPVAPAPAPAPSGSEVAPSSASFLAPTSELTSGVAGGVLPVMRATTANAAPATGGGASQERGVSAPTGGETRAASSAVLTQGGGFAVVVASGGSAAVGDGIVVNRGIADQSLGSGATAEFAIPADAFVASSASAVVSLVARQADGRPLPGWLHFDPASGKFDGQPPPGFVGELSISVVARDAQGHEAVVRFKVKVGERGGRAQIERPGRAGLSEQLRLMGRPHPALERLARAAALRHAA